jgi:hypothetical protein
MQWIVITTANLNDYLVAEQVTAVRTAALADGQSDRFSAVMPDVAARIRNEIAACPNNRLSETANSIPPELKTIACYLILESLQASLRIRLNEDQRRLIDDGRKYLERISKCEIAVSQPDDPEDEVDVQQPGGIEVVTYRERSCTREKFDGL